MSKRKALGRGLNELLSTTIEPVASAESDAVQIKTLPLGRIQRGAYQPRVHFAPQALQELADSIKAQGVIQPIIVRRITQGYELIAGERRWRAAQMAGLQEITAVVRDISDQAVATVALIENIQRENLNPLEQASAMQRLIEEFNLTHQQTADAVGCSRTTVSNLLRLLDLDQAAKQLLDQGQIEMGHARALLGLPSAQQYAAARHIVTRGMSVREAEHYVNGLKRKQSSTGGKAVSKPVEVHKLESNLGDKLGAKVVINHRANGKGTIAISYNSLDELDGILQHIQ